VSESRTPPTGPGQQRGATPVGGGTRGGGRRRALLVGALLLAALVALLLLLSQCTGDDPEAGSDPAAQTSQGAGGSTSASAGPSSAGPSSAGPSSSGPSSSGSAAPSSSAAPSGGAAGGGQVVTADGRSVLPLAAGTDAAAALGGLAGQPVTATGARVLSVPADEGFWLGTSETERVWVQLTGEAGESPYQVQEGDLVDFEGTVEAHDAAFAEQAGVDDAEGAQQLADQAAHLTVAKSAVRLSA
jgi:hypothetical protein